MSTPTIRDHCAALLDDMPYLLACIQQGSSDQATLQEIADRADAARAVLAVEPEVGEGLTDEELWDLFCRFCREDFGNKFMTYDKFCEGARAAIAAAPAAPPAPEPPAEALAARPLVEQMARLMHLGVPPWGELITLSSRAAAWLRENPPGQPVAIEPPACPTPGACSCVEPATPAPEVGEVGELVDALKVIDKMQQEWVLLGNDDDGTASPSLSMPISLRRFTVLRDALSRAATLLEQLSTPAPVVVPVAVSERPWEREGWCDAEGQCWVLSPDYKCWQLRNPRLLSFWVLLLPHHAIPLPQGGEGEE